MKNTNKTVYDLDLAIKAEMQLDPGVVSATERLRFMNDCLDDLAGLGVLEKYVEGLIVPKTGLLPLPDDFIGAISLIWQDPWTELKPLSAGMLTMQGSNPYGYYLRDDSALIIPSFKGKIDMLYNYSPATLLNTSDQPDIPNGKDGMIIDYGVYRGHRKNGNMTLANQYLLTYEKAKAKLVEEQLKKSNSRVTETQSQSHFEILNNY